MRANELYKRGVVAMHLLSLVFGFFVLSSLEYAHAGSLTSHQHARNTKKAQGSHELAMSTLQDENIGEHDRIGYLLDARTLAKEIEEVDEAHLCGKSCTQPNKKLSGFDRYNACIDANTLSLGCVESALDQMEDVASMGGAVGTHASGFEKAMAEAPRADLAGLIIEAAEIFRQLTLEAAIEEIKQEAATFEEEDEEVAEDLGEESPDKGAQRKTARGKRTKGDAALALLEEEEEKLEEEADETEEQSEGFFTALSKKVRSAGISAKKKLFSGGNEEDVELSEEALLTKVSQADGGRTAGGVNRVKRGFLSGLLDATEAVLGDAADGVGMSRAAISSLKVSAQCTPAVCREMLDIALMCSTSEDIDAANARYSTYSSKGFDHDDLSLVASRYSNCAEAALHKLKRYRVLSEKTKPTASERKELNKLEVADVLIDSYKDAGLQNPQLPDAMYRLLGFVAGDDEAYDPNKDGRKISYYEALVRKNLKHHARRETEGTLVYDLSQNITPNYRLAKTRVRAASAKILEQIKADKAQIEALPAQIAEYKKKVASSKTSYAKAKKPTDQAKHKKAFSDASRKLSELEGKLNGMKRFLIGAQSTYNALKLAYNDMVKNQGTNIESLIRKAKAEAAKKAAGLKSKNSKTRNEAIAAADAYQGWMLAYRLGVAATTGYVAKTMRPSVARAKVAMDKAATALKASKTAKTEATYGYAKGKYTGLSQCVTALTSGDLAKFHHHTFTAAEMESRSAAYAKAHKPVKV